MTLNHPVEWWQLGAVLLIMFGALRWYIPAMVEASVASWATKERAKQRAEVEKNRQEIALSRLGKSQATAPPAEVSSGGV